VRFGRTSSPPHATAGEARAASRLRLLREDEAGLKRGYGARAVRGSVPAKVPLRLPPAADNR
jgi:hypothetical protein